MRSAKDGIRQIRIIGVGMALSSSLIAAREAMAGPQFSAFQTHSHVTLPIDPSVNYSVEKVEKDGKLVAIRLILSDVTGAQLEALNRLDGRSDERTDRIKVSRQDSGPSSQIVYEFVLSKKARESGVEFFDYRNKAPSEVALDYWLKASVQRAEAPVKKAEKRKPAAQVSAVKAATSKKSFAESRFAACGQPLSIGTDGFAFWKVYHVPYDYRAFFNLERPDTKYKYPFVAPKKGENFGKRSKEFAHYRLAFKLFKEGKYALVLRTIDFFSQQYGRSEESAPLIKELEFLRANTLLSLSRQLKTDRYAEQAFDLFRSVVLEAPDSERGKVSLAFITQELIGQGKIMQSLEYALIGAEKAPADGSDITPSVYRLAVAEALYALGEHERAEAAYQKIVDQKNSLSADAAFRAGEVFSARKFWERSVIAYEKAIRDFPKESGRFPSAYLNLAEAYFRMERYAEAEKVYGEYAKRFVNDSMAWAGLLRLAELEQMKLKTADASLDAKIHKLYEDVINRQPYSPGAMMAELRLADCYKNAKPSNHKEQSPASVSARNFFDGFFTQRELKKFESPLVESLEVERWMDLVEARFYTGVGEYKSALKRADEYRPKLGAIPLAASFKKTYAEAALGLINAAAKSGEGNDLLAAIEHYGDFVVKPEPFSYHLAIAKAKQAQRDFKGTAEKLSQLESRISEANDSEKDDFWMLTARQRKLLGDKPENVMSAFERIRDNGELAADKYDGLSIEAASKDDFRSAIAYDTRMLEGPLSKSISIEKRFEVAVRRLENAVRYVSPAEVAAYADQALLGFGAQTQLPQLISRVNEIRAQALFDSGKFQAAAAAFSEILANAPEHPRRTQFEFMHGKSLAKLGRENEALETFRKLAKAATDDVWKKSAQAELDQLQWEKDINR